MAHHGPPHLHVLWEGSGQKGLQHDKIILTLGQSQSARVQALAATVPTAYRSHYQLFFDVFLIREVAAGLSHRAHDRSHCYDQ